MNRSVGVGLICLAVGLIGGALIAKSKKPESDRPVKVEPAPPPPPAAAPPPSQQDVSSISEIARLRSEVADLKAKLAEKPADRSEDPEEKEEAVPGDFGERYVSLASKREHAFGEADFARMLKELRKLGPKGLEYLADKLLKSKSAEERFLAAAFMEGLADPASIPALSESLGKDESGLVRRMTSHALAMMKQESGLPALRAAMAGDKEWGVRVNAAYGVAKQGQADGARTLEDLYYSKETAAGYQAIVFGAIADVAAPSSAPFFRRILGESGEMGFQLGAIRAIQKLKDAEAVPLLNRIVGDAKYDTTVRDAARKALDELSK